MALTDSLLYNGNLDIKVFVKICEGGIEQIRDFNSWPEYIEETYNAFYNKNGKPVLFIVIP